MTSLSPKSDTHTSALRLFCDTDRQEPFFPPPQDNSCAVKWDRRRKSIYPRRAALMTWLPSCSGSPSGPTQDAFVSAGWTQRWWVGVQGQRRADHCHTTHSFFRTQAVLLTCVYWHYPWCCPPSSSRWLGLSPRFTGVMVCETGRGRGGGCMLQVCVCVCVTEGNSSWETRRTEKGSAFAAAVLQIASLPVSWGNISHKWS